MAELNISWLQHHLASKSPYPITSEYAEPLVPPRNCKLSQLHVIIRHGTRYPSKSDCVEFENLLRQFTQSNALEKLSWFKTWVNPYHLNMADLLYKQGELDLYALGKRVVNRYRSLFEEVSYNPDRFEFRSSDAQRSSKSGSAFAIGLFEGNGSLTSAHVQPIYLCTIPSGEDTQLRMKFTCPAWLELKQSDDKRFVELFQYASKRLSLTAQRMNTEFPSLNLNALQVEHLYRLCGFEVALFGNASTWCRLLNEDDIHALEYYVDMDEYYSYAFGNQLNGLMACDLVTDIIRGIEAIASGNRPSKGSFHFGHSETIKFLATLLSLHQDDQPFLANSSATFIQNRKLRTSQMSPFAANIAFEIYTCSEDATKPILSTNSVSKVRLLFNEKPMLIPGCNDLYCSWTRFQELLKDKINCDFKQICAFHLFHKVQSMKVNRIVSNKFLYQKEI